MQAPTNGAFWASVDTVAPSLGVHSRREEYKTQAPHSPYKRAYQICALGFIESFRRGLLRLQKSPVNEGQPPKTKTIIELGGEGIAGEQPGGNASLAQSGFVVQENEFLFAVKSCVQSGRILKCAGTITNKSGNKRAVGIDKSSTLVDDEGNQYDLRDIYLDTLSGFTPHQELEPGLAIAFSCSAANVGVRIGRVSILSGT